MVKFVMFHVGLHVHVSEICPNKIPQKINFSRKPVRFHPNIGGCRRLFSAHPSRKFRKEMVHIGHIFM